jgi:hypothetical protein
MLRVLPVVRRPGGWRAAEAEGGRLLDSWLVEGEQAACDVLPGEVVAFGCGQPAGAESLGTPLDPHHVFDCLGDGVQVADHGDQLVAASSACSSPEPWLECFCQALNRSTPTTRRGLRKLPD